MREWKDLFLVGAVGMVLVGVLGPQLSRPRDEAPTPTPSSAATAATPVAVAPPPASPPPAAPGPGVAAHPASSQPSLDEVTLHGIRPGLTREQIRAILGPPGKSGDDWDEYGEGDAGPRTYRGRPGVSYQGSTALIVISDELSVAGRGSVKAGEPLMVNRLAALLGPPNAPQQGGASLWILRGNDGRQVQLSLPGGSPDNTFFYLGPVPPPPGPR